MGGHLPNISELIQVGVATALGTALVFGLVIVASAAFSGALLQGLAFIPFTIAIAVGICAIAAIPSYLLWSLIFKGLLAAKVKTKMAIHVSLVVVTLIVSLGIPFGLGLLKASPVGTMFAFGVVPQLCLFVATKVFLADRNDGKYI